MQSPWQDTGAARFADEFGLRLYSSCRLGRDESRALHGGGSEGVL